MMKTGVIEKTTEVTEQSRQRSTASVQRISTRKCFECAAVVIIPYPAKDVNTTNNALWIVAGTGITKVVIVYDKRSTNGRKIAAKASKNAHMMYKLTSVVVECDLDETGYRWQLGLDIAFKQFPEIKSVLLIPGDLVKMSAEGPIALEQAIIDTKENSLCVVDYSLPPGKCPFKDTFDRRFTLPFISALWPDVMDSLLALGISKLRSEMFCIGRSFYTTFTEERDMLWSDDPTVKLILWPLLRKLVKPYSRFTVSKVHAGEFEDVDTRKAGPETWQTIRLACALMKDFSRFDFKDWTGIRQQSHDDTMNHYPQLMGRFYALGRALDHGLLANYIMLGGDIPNYIPGNLADALREAYKRLGE